MKIKSISIVLFILISAYAALAQTTEFTYQGSLKDGPNPAIGNYDFEFALFDAVSGGNQIGATLTRNTVTVTNGIFAVQLDFGGQFPGAARFFEIRVRASGQPTLTTLTPRHFVNSAPYSVKTLNADNATNAANAINATTANGLSSACVGCVQNSHINSVDGGKVIGTVANATTANNALNLGGVAANQYLLTNGNGSGLTNLNAGSITTGTLSNARLGQIPTANIADSAVTSAKIAAGQVVKGLTVGATTLTDNVTLAQGANITITPAGNTLTIASTGGGGGVGGSGTTNSIPLWSSGTTLGNSVMTQSAGNLGIGTSSPVSKFHVVSDPGSLPPRVTSSGTTGFSAGWDFYLGATGKGYVGVPDPSAVFGPGEMLLFGGSGLKTSLWANQIRALTVETNGNVGIGTNTPQARLDVRGDVRLGGSGQYFATGGEENLRIVRGVISASGAILAGAGFSVSRPDPQVGTYTVTFDVPFSSLPAITATVQSGSTTNNYMTTTNVGINSTGFSIYNGNQQFHFIAIGPR